MLLFLFLMLLVGTILGARRGMTGLFDSTLKWIFFRFGFLLPLTAALFELLRNRLRRSRIYILVYFLISIIASIIGPPDDQGIHLLIVLLNAVFALQVGMVMDMSVRDRSVYLLFINLYLLLILFLYRSSIAENSNPMVGAISLIGFFIYFAVLIPNLIAEIKNQKIRRILRDMAYNDELSSLPAKYALLRDLEEALSTCSKGKEDLALIGLSVRNLAYINRRYGHDAGDCILKEVAGSLKGLKGCEAYRLTGAMFVFFSRESWTPEQSRQLETELRSRLPKRLKLEEGSCSPDYDLLGTLFPFDGRHAGHLIRNLQNMVESGKKSADTLMIQWFDKKDFWKQERQYLLAGHLDRAFRDREFYILIQPQIDIRKGRLFGGEVLSRWNHPELGLVSPVEFISVLEREGRSFEFASSLVERCLSLSCSADKKSLGECNMALNLSASTLSDPGVLRILKSLHEKGRAFRPEIEITEDLFLMLDEEISQRLKDIRSLGFGLSLDDFGTGFSNLGYLQDLEVDSLKIDRRFISPLPGDDNTQSIVRAIINMAHSFGIKVIAEGVETREQYELLRDLGCDIIQGFYFAKPMLPDDFIRFAASFDPEVLR